MLSSELLNNLVRSSSIRTLIRIYKPISERTSSHPVVKLCAMFQSTSYASAKRDAIDDAYIHYEDFLQQKSLKGWKADLTKRHKHQIESKKFFTAVLAGSKRKAFWVWSQEVELMKIKKQQDAW